MTKWVFIVKFDASMSAYVYILSVESTFVLHLQTLLFVSFRDNHFVRKRFQNMQIVSLNFFYRRSNLWHSERRWNDITVIQLVATFIMLYKCIV